MYPVIFKIYGLTVYSYGAMLALAFLLAIVTAVFRAQKLKIDSQVIFDLGIVVILSGVLGARLFFVLLNFSYYAKNPAEIIRMDKGGLVVLGGVIASIIIVYIYCRVKRLDPFDIADIVAPSLSLGQAVGRLGCFLNGCCWGIPTGLPIGVCFPPRDFMPAEYWGIPLHPVQLYNTFGNLILFCFLSYIFKKRKVKGEVFAFYLILHPILRFGMEFLRGDNEKAFAGLTVFQIMSIFLFIAGVIMMAVIRKNKKLKVKSGKK